MDDMGAYVALMFGAYGVADDDAMSYSLSTEIPAPVKATTYSAERIKSTASWIAASTASSSTNFVYKDNKEKEKAYPSFSLRALTRAGTTT